MEMNAAGLHEMARSSSVWGQSRGDVFSVPNQGDDDEESLKWAALERLPTFSRVRKGILADMCGPVREIDVNKLGFEEKKALLDRVVKIAEEDNEKFLIKLRERLDRVGIDIPTIEVRYEHLNVHAQVHVGSRSLPSVFNFFINTFEGFLNLLRILPKKRVPFTILHDVSGVIKPGRMTLLLGPPGAGKTTLLSALAGRLSKNLQVSGRVTFNGQTFNDFVPQRTAAYISQHDLHLGELTVRETLSFAGRVQGVGTNYDILVELLRREKAAGIKPDPDIDIYMKAAAMEGQKDSIVIDYILKILGLDICADTIVGNEMTRGISGGQKRRLTTGEMMVGPAKAFFMDEISTGLDSSTTYQIVNSIRHFIHILNGTALISLLQPAPETYDLFDDILLLADGVVVYHGPRENVLEFFEFMGFKCPERKGVADFLQEVTSTKDQEQYWCRREDPYKFVTVKEFANAFHSFHIGRRLGNDLAVPFDKLKGHPAALTKQKYGLGEKEMLKTCMSREALLMKRNSSLYISKSFQLMITALIAATLFSRFRLHKQNVRDGGVFMGSIYFSLNRIVFNGLAEMTLTITRLPVFYKHRDLLFYPSWVYAIPSWILKVPLSFIETAIYVAFTYYTIGYDSDIGRLFKQYLLFVVVHQMASGLFRVIAGLGRSMVLAQTFGTGTVVMLLVLGGYIMSPNTVKKWWIWGYWVSPLMYGQNALSVNEFLGESWSLVLPAQNVSLGIQVLESRGIFTQSYWYWIGFGVLLGYIFLFNVCYIFTLTYLNPLEKPQVILPKKALDENNPNLNGQAIEKPYRGKISAKSEGEEHFQNTVDGSIKGGMILPFEPLAITFHEIRYSVDMPLEMKAKGITEDRLELLKGVSGAFRPGVLTALMGISGAGKTTLLDVLAGRKTGGYIDGEIRISGYPKRQETFARVCGYCEQSDIHSPHLTVQESLMFSARLRLSSDVDATTRKMFVEEIMGLVELNYLRNALVGLPRVSGLSIEQRKRLTIAVELVANPSIIFMDEPTSGLDARAAAVVMRTIRNTVNTGRTVVCTIHQPSIAIFDAFDELLLLKRGGEQIYFGSIGCHAQQLISYFEGINGVSKIKDGHNPATWMLEVTSMAQEAVLGVDFAQLYKNSDLSRSIKSMIKELSVPDPASKDLYFPTMYSQSALGQFMACLWKQRCSYWRNTNYTAMKLLFAAFIGIVFGSMFWQVGSNRDQEVYLFNAMGSIYIAVIFLGIKNSSGVQPIVFIERAVFYRERAAGMYSALCYAFAQVIIELPYCFLQTLFYGVIVYAMMGFEWTVAKFLWYIFIMYFTLMYFTYFGMMCASLSSNPSISSIISSAFYSIWNVFSGFLIPRTRIPVWWRWYYWGCPISYSLYGLLVSQFGDYENQLDNGQTVKDFVCTYFGYKRELLVPVAGVILGFSVLFSVVFAYSIKTINFQRR